MYPKMGTDLEKYNRPLGGRPPRGIGNKLSSLTDETMFEPTHLPDVFLYFSHRYQNSFVVLKIVTLTGANEFLYENGTW